MLSVSVSVSMNVCVGLERRVFGFRDENFRTAKTQSFIFNWKSSSPESRFHIRAVSSSEHENTCMRIIA